MLGETMERPFFVYGSLMQGFWNEEKYLKGKVIRRESGTTKGRLYHIANKGYPAMVEGKDPVYGEVIWVKSFCEVVEDLDTMENYSKKQLEKSQYMRVVQQIQVGDREIEAYVYRYNPDAKINQDDQLNPVPQGSWRSYMSK